ncbi:hypothetical protein ACLMJK_003732 [Lecanora helva]
MSSSHSQFHRPASYSQRENRTYEDVSRQYLPVQEGHSRTSRQRSSSRVRHPYTSNCSRRRWPPSPKVEEVKQEEEIPMRGKIGQNPMIIDVPSSTSSDSASTSSNDSDDSSGPETPPTDSDNRDGRYAWKPEPDTPLHQVAEKLRDSQRAGRNTKDFIHDTERGRRTVPRLDTEFAKGKSAGEPIPQLERARSPYASGPQDRKPKPERSSGEYMLSPDVISPRKAYPESPRTQYIPRPSGPPAASGRLDETVRRPARPSLEARRSKSYHIPRPVEIHNDVKDNYDGQSPRTTARPSLDRRSSALPYPDSPRHSGRPTMDRRASEMPSPSTRSLVGGHVPSSRTPNAFSDESDSDSTKSRIHFGQVSPQTTSRYSTSSSLKEGRHHNRRLSSDLPITARHHQRKLSTELPVVVRHHERKFSTELPASPLRQSIPSSGATDPPVNLSSLVSGAAISQTLNATLKGDRDAARNASPRPSPRGSPTSSPLPTPRGSPKTSPFTSPPRTPPSEPSQHRANLISGLKRDSPSSRPSSPLSSRSSLWTVEPDSSSRRDSHGGASRPVPISRKTTPLPMRYFQNSREENLLNAPEIAVRSPSPAKHTKSFSAESGKTPSAKVGSDDDAPDHRSRSRNLAPATNPSRQRSASSVDFRPQLTVDTMPAMRTSGPSAKSKSRAASPNPVSPSQRHKPSYLNTPSTATQTRCSKPEAASSTGRARSKSRSHVPDTTTNALSKEQTKVTASAPTAGSKSTSSSSDSASLTSRPSAPTSKVQFVTPIPPAKLPKCPRPQPVAGYDDWYTLRENHSFAICPTCRDGVFGHSIPHSLQPRSDASSRKTSCDLNNPWVRLALSLRGPDVKILSALSDVSAKERSCPGDELASRDWYRLEDAESGKHISGFNACPHCVHSLETLLPAWQKVFYRSRSHEIKERFCGLRASPHRFGDYLNMMIESAQEADRKKKHPHTASVCELAKQLAAIDDCPKDRMFPRKAWHIHPHLPEFTICQECYENVVYPIVLSGSSLAAKIDKKPHQFPNPETEVCCHLYSPRMRKVFREACEDEDYDHLRHTVHKRHMLQQDIFGTFRELQEHKGDQEVEARLGALLEKWKDKE